MFMSDDERERVLARAETSLVALRSLTPLRCAVAVPDVHGPRERPANGQDIFACLLRLLRSTIRVDAQAPIFHGETYMTVTAVASDTPEADGKRAHSAFRGVASTLLGVVHGLAPSVRARLGITDDLHSHGSWERILFHLAWHFPHHFLTSIAWRFRMGRLDKCPEEFLQLWRVNGSLEEPFPNLMFSVMSEPLDLATASECAIRLFREATCPTPRLPDDWKSRLSGLRPRFERRAREVEQFDGILDLAAWLIRADSTFATRSASEWGGLPDPRGDRAPLPLSRSGCVVEWCVIQGGWYDLFLELANLAGSLVPSWPEPPSPNILGDMDQWEQTLPDRRRIAAQDWSCVEQEANGTGGASQQFPAWVRWPVGSSARADRLVTDHRNNVERWVGLVYSVLKLREPDALQVKVVPESGGHGINPWNCMLTLRDLNLFEASARVIGWLLPDAHAKTSADPSAPAADAQQTATSNVPSSNTAPHDVQLVQRLVDLACRIQCREPGGPSNEFDNELKQCRDSALGVKTDSFLPFERWRAMVRELEDRLRPLLTIPVDHPDLWTCRHAVQEPLQRIADVLPRLRAEKRDQNPAATSLVPGTAFIPAPAAQEATGEKSANATPPDQFAKLRQFARGLKGQERAIIEALCDADGELMIADLAIKEGVGWDDPKKGFTNAQRRLNGKLKNQGWTVIRHDNAARLSAVKTRKTL